MRKYSTWAILCMTVGGLVGCGAPDPSMSIDLNGSKRSERLQEQFLEDVTDVNIAAALDRRCPKVSFDDEAQGALIEQFAVKVLILASRERKDAKWAAAYLDQTEKLRKSTLTKAAIAEGTNAYLEDKFSGGWEEDRVCEQALAEISGRTGVGRFLDQG